MKEHPTAHQIASIAATLAAGSGGDITERKAQKVAEEAARLWFHADQEAQKLRNNAEEWKGNPHAAEAIAEAMGWDYEWKRLMDWRLINEDKESALDTESKLLDYVREIATHKDDGFKSERAIRRALREFPETRDLASNRLIERYELQKLLKLRARKRAKQKADRRLEAEAKKQHQAKKSRTKR